MGVEVTDVGEVAGLLRSLRGETIGVCIHPAGDLGGFSIASFSGRLGDIEEDPGGECMRILFQDPENSPVGPAITIEPDRFVKANLACTISEEDVLYPPEPDNDGTVFIFIRTVDAVVELTAWV